MYGIEYLEIFRDDLHYAHSYIKDELHNEQAANKLIGRVQDTIQRIGDLPHSCPIYAYAETVETYRAVSVGNYLLFYTVDDTHHTVTIARLVYMRMDMYNVFH